MATDTKNNTGRWAPPPKRWKSLKDREDAASKFLEGVKALIEQRKSAHEWTDAETLGVRLADHLQTCFSSGAPEEWIPLLSRALRVFDEADGVKARRYHCVRAIVLWGERWAKPEWQATDETRRLLLKQCVDELAFHDEAFAELHEDLDRLGERLSEFSRRSQRGKKTAETILAEILVEDVTALEMHALDDDHASSVDNVRKKLVRDVDAFLAAMNPAEKQP